MEIKFYVCKHCGNIVTYIKNSGIKVKCCGEEMQEIIPNTIDAAKEKHLPVIKNHDNMIEISVGEVIHPMTEEHLIDWIYIQTLNGGQIIYLNEQQQPIVKIPKMQIVKVYSHCNLHGLWEITL